MSIPILWLIILTGVALIIYGSTRPNTGFIPIDGLGYVIVGALILLVVAAYKLGSWIG